MAHSRPLRGQLWNDSACSKPIVKTPIVDIVIKTYPGDFEWLTYCLRSIQRFATGFRNVIVISPAGQQPPTGAVELTCGVHEHGEGYMYQQNVKLHADAFSNADYLCYMDSDTIFTRPVTPGDLIVEEKVRWLYTPYSSIDSGDGQTWKEPTSKVMMQPVPFEFMRRHPLVAPRWALEGFRQWMWKVHGVSLEHYILTQPGRSFSEWNALGAWLWFYHRDKVHWQNTDEDLGITYVHQSFSWGGLSAAIRADLERALA